jgi:hypothetical protein
MGKDACPLYKETSKEIHSQVIQGDRNPRKPTISIKKWCAHPESKHRLETISGNVQCDGDLKKCSIPTEDWIK